MTQGDRKSASTAKRWALCALVYAIVVAVFFNMIKPSPIFPQLFEFGFTGETIGLVMSLSGFLGLLLAFPGGWIIGRVGLKNAILLALAFELVGCGMGAFAQDWTTMLVARGIEGGGTALIAVAGPASVVALLPRSKHGAGMGFYSAMFPLGIFAGVTLSPIIYGMTGDVHAPWIVGTAVTAILLLAVIMFFFVPERAGEGKAPSDDAPRFEPQVLTDVKPLWKFLAFVVIAFCAYNFDYSAFTSFYPTYLMETFGVNNATAGLIVGVQSIIMIAAGPIAGIIMDKTGQHKWMLVAGLAGTTACFTFAFVGNLIASWAFVIVFGLFSSLIGPAVMTMIPILVRRPDKVALGMATNAFFLSLGNVCGNTAFGPVELALGWQAGSMALLVTVGAVGLVASLLVREGESVRIAEKRTAAAASRHIEEPGGAIS